MGGERTSENIHGNRSPSSGHKANLQEVTSDHKKIKIAAHIGIKIKQISVKKQQWLMGKSGMHFIYSTLRKGHQKALEWFSTQPYISCYCKVKLRSKVSSLSTCLLLL